LDCRERIAEIVANRATADLRVAQFTGEVGAILNATGVRSRWIATFRNCAGKKPGRIEAVVRPRNAD